MTDIELKAALFDAIMRRDEASKAIELMMQELHKRQKSAENA